MSSWVTPVYDRAVPDDLFLSINRIEGNLEYLHDYVNANGYTTSTFTVNNWVISDEPTYDELQPIIDYINELQGILISTGVSTPSDFDRLTYLEENDIEENTYTLKQLFEGTINGFTRLAFTLGGQKLWG